MPRTYYDEDYGEWTFGRDIPQEIFDECADKLHEEVGDGRYGRPHFTSEQFVDCVNEKRTIFKPWVIAVLVCLVISIAVGIGLCVYFCCIKKRRAPAMAQGQAAPYVMPQPQYPPPWPGGVQTMPVMAQGQAAPYGMPQPQYPPPWPGGVQTMPAQPLQQQA